MRIPVLLTTAMFLLTTSVALAQTPITMQRVITPVLYTPGDTLTVTVTISKEDSRTVTALGIEETIPDEWTFGALDKSIGAPPPITQAKTGSVEFAYITMPEFPITFSYTVVTSLQDSGKQAITGQVIYRFSGDELQSPLVGTQVSVAGQGEGESEGETEGEDDNDDGTGCFQCASDKMQAIGVSLGDLFLSALALISLAALSRRHF